MYRAPLQRYDTTLLIRLLMVVDRTASHARSAASQILKSGALANSLGIEPQWQAESDALRLDFDRRLKLEFHGASVTSDAGLLAYRELDDALGLMGIEGQYLVDGRTGRNGRHDLVGVLRQSVSGRLAEFEDVNDAAG